MADEIITLSPEQEAQYNAAAAQPPTPTQSEDINPLRDLDANQIFELAVADPDNFDIAAEFSRQPELHGDQATVQKTAEALHLLRQRGFKFADLPGPRKIAGAAVDIAKGFGKQVLNYLTAGVNVGTAAASDLLGGDSGTSDALLQESQRRVAKNIAGTEASVTGLSGLVQRAAGKIGRGIGALTNKIFRPGMVGRTIGLKPLEEFSPEDKVKQLFDEAGKIQTQQEIAQGKGAFLTGVGGEVVKELEEAGKPIRPEEVAELAPGDPFAWWTFGKALGQTGRLVPTPVKAAAARVGEKAGELATVAGGKTVQALGEATRLTAKGVEKAAPAVGLVKGAAEAGPLGALAGLKAGELVRPITRRLGAAGAGLAQVGKDIAAAGVAPTAAAQLGRDVIQSIPGVAGGFAHGAAMDVGLAAVTSESPAETEASVGLGATLGGLGGTRRAGQRILSGQLIAPRNWGSNTPVPSSGNFKPLDAMHSVAYATAEPAVRQRINAVREFVNGAAPGTDVFLARDAASIEKALTDAGVDPATAKSFSEQEGFFTADLGGGRRVVVIKNAEAAPHESFHAFQDVLGEQANRVIDKIMRDTYADRWEAEGQKYAQRLTGQPTPNWRDAILDASGWGHAEAMEKLSIQAANKIRAETGAEPNPDVVADLVRGAWGRAQRETGGNPREAWREVLTPEEQAAVADRYIARELAAENFDAVFKNLGGSLQDQPGVIPAIARIVGKVVEAFGGEPLATRTSEFGAVPLRTAAVEAVRGAVTPRQRPTIEPATTPAPRVTSSPAEEAQQIAAEAPTTAIAGGRSPRELLGSIAEAIAQQAGVKINYLSAPGEPAAATTSNRAARREIIETFRTMPPEARALWEKNFFPDRVIKLKGDKYQVLGWAPEVFASNAHKMADALAKSGQEVYSPYEIDVRARTFTEQGWKDLFSDVQTFVKNQMAGQTGAGQELVVPRSVTERGFTAPPSRASSAVGLDQNRADFINILFGYKLPETPRIQKGKLPLNIAGQEVSTATQPGRIRKPVVARDPFTGPEAEQQGIEGREILEVNPLRETIQSVLKDAYPSLIEAQQRLNLENIKEVDLSPEQPQFRGNTLTLTAGFQPKADEPRAVKSAAVRFPSGKIYEGTIHIDAMDRGFKFEPGYKDMENPNISDERYTQLIRGIEDGFTTNDGEFLSREGALQRAQELQQLTEKDAQFFTLNDAGIPFKSPGLESVDFDQRRQFQPVAERAQSIKDMTDEQWNAEVQNFKGTLGSGPTGWGFDLGSKVRTADELSALKTSTEALQEITRAAIRERDMNTAGRLATRAQIAHEAYQAATGEKIDGTPAGVDFIRRHYKSDYSPPMPGESFKKWDAAQPDAAERAALEKQFDIPPESGSVAKMAAQPKKRKSFYEEWRRDLNPYPGPFDAVESFIRVIKNRWRDAKQAEKEINNIAPRINLTKTAFDQIDWNAVSREYSTRHPESEESDATVRGLADKFLLNPDTPLNSLDVFEKRIVKEFLQLGREQLEERGIETVQFQPKRRENQYKLPRAASGGFKKAWVLPNGEVAQLGGDWHHQWLAENPDVAKKYGLDVPEFTGTDTENVREDAMRKGFVRVNYGVNNGTLVIEGRAKDWRKIKSTMENMVESNIDDVDNVTVHLFDDKIERVLDSETRRLFVHDNDADKMANLPFSERDPRGTGARQFQPKKEDRFVPGVRPGSWISGWVNNAGDILHGAGKKHHPDLLEENGWLLTEAGIPDEQFHNTIAEVASLDDTVLKRLARRGLYSFIVERDGTLTFDNPPTKVAREAAETLKEKLLKGQFQPERMRRGIFADELNKVRTGKSGGQTFNADGSIWNAESPSDIVTLASVNIPADSLTPEAYHEATAPYKELLSRPGVVAGVFSFSKEGKPTVSIDINAVVPKEFRDNSVQFAKDNDQVAIWDAEKSEEVKTGGKGNTRLTDPDDLAVAAESLVSGEPIDIESFTSRAPEPTLFRGQRVLSNAEVGSLTREQLKRQYPEAIIPESKKEKIPSNITESPLYKSAGSESQAVKSFARRLVEFAKENQDRPEYKLGEKWYSEFVPQLRKEFGKDAQLMAELLAATSPQTNVETNFGYALDALESMKAGRFNKIIDKYNQGLDMIAENRWTGWYNKNLKDIPNPPAEPTPAAFLAHWIETHNLKPTQSNGKLYGQHSLPVLQVLTRRWLDSARGPKTLNFVQNLLGTGHEATIDLWADRTMRRIGYEGSRQRWRILPHNTAPVSETDFTFAQKAFSEAAKELGIKPDALQGALWFSEKQLWADNGWSRLDLGDFRREMAKVPMLRAGYRHRLDKIQRAAKLKPAQEQELLIEPRKTK